MCEDVLFAGRLFWTSPLPYRLLSHFKNICSILIGGYTTYEKQSPPITTIATFFLLRLSNLWHAVSKVLSPTLSI